MKSALLLALGLSLAACSIHIDHDEKSGDIKKVHVSIGRDAKDGNGQLQTVTRPLGAVTAVASTGSIDVDIRIGSPASLVVEGDANLLALIETVQQGDKLVIKQTHGFSSDNPLRVKLVMPGLRSLESTGSGDITVSALAGGDLEVDMTGSGETRLSGRLGALTARLVGSGDLVASDLAPASVKIEVMGSGDAQLGSELAVSSFDAAVKGSGSISAGGKTAQLNGDILGSGDLDLKDLQADNATLALLGSGDIVAYASQSVTATAKGSGDIVIYGAPAKQTLSGEHARLAP